jgi:hypothetical protein
MVNTKYQTYIFRVLDGNDQKSANRRQSRNKSREPLPLQASARQLGKVSRKKVLFPPLHLVHFITFTIDSEKASRTCVRRL